MSIFNFVKRLLPRIERSTVAEDLRTTEKECLNIVMPSWDSAATHFKMNKPSSDELQEMSQLFYRNFDMRKASKSTNFIADIARRVPVLHENIAMLQATIDQHLEKDIIADGLTARSAFVLRAASNVSLLTRYLLALLNYMYTVEAKHFDVTLEPGLEISKAEMKYVDQNFVRFVKLFSEYTMPAKEFKALVGEVPEVFVNQQAQNAVAGLYNKDSIDPFEKYGVSGFVGNPIYRVRLMVAKWQNDRYESAKSKKQQLELRLLYLQMQKDEVKDPGVVKEIERLQSRIEGYDKYLREVEESIAEDK